MPASSESDQSKGRFEDEITFQEIVYALASIVTWVKKHFIKLAFFGLLGVGVSVFWLFRQTPSYTAELTFMLNDDNNPQISGIGGFLGQLGLPVSGGKYNVDKLLEISKSRSRIESTLLTQVQINNSTDYLANHFIKIFELDPKWFYGDESLKGFSFNTHNSALFDAKEHFVMKALCQLIAGNKNDRSDALFTTDYGKTDYIMSFSFESPSEELSISFINELYDQVSQFYVDKTIEKNQSIFDIIETKKDSIATLISNLAYQIAEQKDKGNASFRKANNVNIVLLENQLMGLQTAYEEIVKNFERAQFVLETSTPLIQILDRPTLPLSVHKPSPFKSGLVGLIVGIMVYLFLIFLQQILIASKSDFLSPKIL